MSQSDLIEKKGDEEKNLGDEIQTVIYRFPKKNHDKMVEFSKPFTDVFRKYGVSRWGIFQLRAYPKTLPLLYVIHAQTKCNIAT